jgi:pyridoxal phosphate enzyme (YggS family)
VISALRAGLTDLGENFAQEARDKREAVLAAIGDAAPPRWHMIGRLQRNKAALALRLFDSVETVDRAELARELDKRAAAAGRTLNVLLQINLSGEVQKAGVAPAESTALLATCCGLEQLRVRGLMAIPAAGDDPEASRAAFAQLRQLRDTLSAQPGGEPLGVLSMGMSNDFEVAIEEGATSIRVGTALFGERPAREI